MTLLFVVVGVALLAFPALADGSSFSRPPGEWARVVASCLVAGAVITELGLLLTALPTVLHLPVLAELTGACHSVVDRLAVEPFIGWASLLVAAAVLTTALASTAQCRRLGARARVEPWIGVHHARPGYELVIVPTPAALAFSVDGPAPQVVVSDGITQRLSDDELEAVIEHEVAHLRLRHRRYLVIATTVARAFTWLPLVRSSAGVLREAVEEWADETTARTGRARRRELGMALATMIGTHRGESDVEPCVRRLSRLASSARLASAPDRAATYSPALSLGAAGLLLLTAWLGASHHLFSLSGYCPS